MDILERREIARVIGRIITLLIDKNVITREEAFWVLEPNKEGNIEDSIKKLMKGGAE